jgi:hypothetical protein
MLEEDPVLHLTDLLKAELAEIELVLRPADLELLLGLPVDPRPAFGRQGAASSRGEVPRSSRGSASERLAGRRGSERLGEPDDP